MPRPTTRKMLRRPHGAGSRPGPGSSLADFFFDRALNEPDKALGYLLRALREKPDWEDVHQDVIMIYFQQGRRDDAVAQYRHLVEVLDRMFGIKPSKDTRRLYDVISAV